LSDLLIDRAASALLPDESDLRAWSVTQRVFVSSLIDGYEDRRQAAADAIESFGATPVMFERFGGRDGDPIQAYLNEVASSSIYVGLLGPRYGKPLPSRYSATHEEYRSAEHEALRLSVWVEDGVEREGPQQSFLDEVRTFNVTGRFADPADLTSSLERRLREIAAEELAPWCKLGPMVFRASEIEVAGSTGTIRAVIRDGAVAAALREFADGCGQRSTTFAYWDGVYDSELTGISTRSTSTQAREFTIQLRVSSPAPPTAFSMNGMSWEELTELAMRVSWFGEANPLGITGGTIEMANPFAELAASGVPDDALRPIAFVLAQEVLVRDRGIQGLTKLRLGSSVSGRRRIRLGWQPARTYTNEPLPEQVEIDGDIALS
jgi:Domain of unknown function (DUF4062)